MPADGLYVVLSTRAGDGLREVRQNRPFNRLVDVRNYANRERGCDLHFGRVGATYDVYRLVPVPEDQLGPREGKSDDGL